MCELFGLSGRLPTTVSLSIRVLERHGSHTSGLDDGWGVAFHAGDDALLVKQPGPADESPWIDFLARHPIRTRIVVSHIRRATQGEVSLRNTQPFMRELGGRMHVFAHNGRLTGIERRVAGASRRFRPVGSTDSEVAFCMLLDRLAPLWDAGTPSAAQRLQEIASVAEVLRTLGPANFLYADGGLLVAHAHRRTQRDGSIAPPGLWIPHRSCAVDPDALASAGVTLDGSQLVTLFASVPLTDEAWRPLQEGEIAVARDGVLDRLAT
jgi:predicted glutamine amidotransferase